MLCKLIVLHNVFLQLSSNKSYHSPPYGGGARGGAFWGLGLCGWGFLDF